MHGLKQKTIENRRNIMRSIMLKAIDGLGKFGLDKLEYALLFGLALAAILGFASGSIQMSQV
ncbi:MAG: hypothetical protein H6R26_246, partial [Proteobacteria bacterium]|nr:hypothetical protein [Pseudomonadota bacterium]